MIKAVFFDAGGVLFLNNNGFAVVNEEVINFIKTSKDTYIFGVLSSTEFDLTDIVASYELGDVFKIVQTPGESGIQKDTPEFFAMAVETAKIRPDEAIMVDNDANFIKAAKTAGLFTIEYTPGTDLESAIKSLT